GEVESQVEPEGYRQRLLAELKQHTPPTGPNVRLTYVLAEGNPAEQIERVAREQQCGLIVMGTHGRTGLQRLLMGSIAEHVVRHAACPVLTVNMRTPTTEEPA